MSAALMIIALLAAPQALAATAASVPEGGLEYPELSVTPRASERLEREAAREAESRWTTLVPFYISGAATLAAGIIQTGNSDPGKDPRAQSGYAGIVTGGAWLVGGLALAAFYRPYSLGVADITDMPRKSEREQLYRERIAEEDLETPARLVRRLSWLSAITNLASGVYMIANAQSGSLSIPADLVAMAAALTPLFFQPYWTRVAQDQQEYRKRIYAPVASAALFRAPVTGQLSPGLSLTFFY